MKKIRDFLYFINPVDTPFTFLCFVLIILVILLLVPSKRKTAKHENQIFRNEQFVLVGTNESNGVSNDKFQKPVVYKIWLIRRVNDTTQYAEIGPKTPGSNHFGITRELWYSRKVGDTLNFDYIRKDRFFRVNGKKGL